MKSKKGLSSFLVLLYMVTFILPTNIVKAATEYVSVTKTVNVTQMTNEEEAEVTLSIKGTPPVDVVKPNDVVLIIDKSGSMGTEKMEAAKSAAKSFIDLMDMTKHQVGLVDFSDNAYATPLTTDVTGVKNRISNLSAGGGTQTGVAIRSAINVLSNHRPEAQPVIVILTDGAASNTQDALNAAQQAKDLGIVFYTIALLGSTDNPDTNQWNTLLKNMATTEHHHHFVLGSQGLDAIYKAIVQEIGIASAYNVIVKDTIAPNFELVPGSADGNIPKPTINGNELTWNFLELKQDTLNFTYKIRHKSGQPMGTIPVGTNTTVSYSDFAGAKREFTVTSPSITVKYPAPIITSIEADNGEIAGGNEVIIRGDKFRQGATVHFGGKLATNVTVVNSNEIRATVPASTVGIVAVKVTNDDSQFATTSYRYWASPVITKINPNNGPLEGGNIVAIEGNYFASGIKVFFGTVEARATYKNPMLVYAYVPQGVTPGTVDLTLTNVDGTTITRPSAYTYNGNPTPAITSITPNSGELKGGNVVTIAGSNLEKVSSVKFGEIEGTSLTIIDGNTIKVTIPAATAASVVDVTVVNADGQTAKLSSAYTYVEPPKPLAPTIISLTPNEGQLVGGEYVYISGTNFQSGLTAKLGGVQVPIATYYDSTKFRIKIPAGTVAGAVDLEVINPDGQATILPGAYTYLAPPPPPAPNITSLSQTQGLITGGEYLYVYGTGFQNTLAVKLGGVEVPVATYYDSTKFRIKIPATTIEGAVDLEVINPDGQATRLPGAYTYLALPPAPAPTITSLSQTTGLTIGGEYVYVNGTGFQPNLTVKLGGVEIPVATYYSNIKFRIKMPQTTTAGPVDLEIINPDGLSVMLPAAYTYTLPVPTITSLSANTGSYSGGYSNFISGSFFDPNAKVYINGIEVNSYFSTTNQIKILSMPSAESLGLPIQGGTVDVEVRNPSGITATTTFTYQAKPSIPVPVITKTVVTGSSVSAGPITGGTYLYFYGTGFAANMKLRIYNPSGTVIHESILTNFYNATYARQKMPAVSSSGIYKLTLVNSEGIESNAMFYEYK
ncbi:IPT/TIG domain-containing protein [Clostridium sp. UBA4548]|uniref:IPT/TIG domain-containing protein n=1 Tax=Clostridium sp. UBA4548 TaxID=1946361 RepID=UPI0025BBC384|nr:IPT/TIG domain-containing protein [Clostridium sp. UBA4548]